MVVVTVLVLRASALCLLAIALVFAVVTAAYQVPKGQAKQPHHVSGNMDQAKPSHGCLGGMQLTATSVEVER